MFRTLAMSAMTAAVIVSAPAGAAAVESNRCGSLGPYATIDDTKGDAHEARILGFRILVFYDGDGYYVRVC